MRKGLLTALAAGMVIFALAGAGWGQHGHGQPAPPPGKKSGSKEAAPAKSAPQVVNVEGLKVSLEVMNMDEHMKHEAKGGGHGQADHSQSHMLMVTLQDTASKEILSDAQVRFSLLGPGEEKESGKLAWSGDHYGAGFSGKKKGKWQVQLKIESGGMEREARFEVQAK